MIKISISTVLLVFLFCTCNEINTEIVGETYFDDSQLAVIGYLSNKGAVVHLQLTQSPTATDTNNALNTVAKVELKEDNTNNVAAVFKAYDKYNYCTPDGFIPQMGQEYYLKVEAAGYNIITSEPLSIMTGPKIDSIRLEMHEVNKAGLDTVYYSLFGHPRSFKSTYFVNNKDKQISNLMGRQLFRFNSELYEYIDRYALFEYPSFFIYLGTGTTHFLEIPDQISGFYIFYDHIPTGESVDYKGENWDVYERLDSVLVQTIQYSDEFVDFFERINNYLEERRNPFSSAANNIPSNLSSKIGYFGNVFIVEEEIALPTTQSDTITYVF